VSRVALRTAADLLALLAADPERMRLLRALRDECQAQAWIGAGFVRNLAWDALHGHAEPTPLADVDVLYFAPEQLAAEADARIERALRRRCADVPWSVRNQARMHLRNGDRAYRDLADALCHWPEVCTALAVRLRGDALELLAPLGIDDLLALRVRPTEHFRGKPEVYRQRLLDKAWQRRWPLLRIDCAG
jgi:hypothetical protein